MATLERKRKSISRPIQEDTQPTTTVSSVQDDQDLLDDLAKEPVEYNNLCCLSPQVVESLQSVKHTCLVVLDALLKQIIKELPPTQSNNRTRRLSDSSCNLLSSLTQHTNVLQELSNDTSMSRSQSTPPPAIISDLYRLLDSNSAQHSTQYYTLSCSLAALLNDIYRLLELNSTQQHQDALLASRNDDITFLQQELHDKVSTFRHERAQGIMSIVEQDASQEMIMLWDEMDHLMNIVTKLAIHQLAPPAYDESDNKIDIPTKEKLPTYDSVVETNQNDLDQLLDAIDRLSHTVPRLNDQRVCLTDTQMKELAAAALSKSIERLSKGRMENQCASLPAKTRQEVLHDLVLQIQKSASRSLDNQRVVLNTQKQRNIELASIHGLVSRLEKTRYSDQDWISHEEMLIKDLSRTTDLLVKSLNRPAYNRQRYSLPATKERNMFMSSLFDKVQHLEKQRFVNQDAEFTSSTTRTL
ncbi:hypothetical protein EDC96DRAFT_531156 [Choanephora cucurbitarum]|nr:hypothetical protein EDC96DRAFT_531156 [Choanephora cucurbitarum]